MNGWKKTSLANYSGVEGNFHYHYYGYHGTDLNLHKHSLTTSGAGLDKRSSKIHEHARDSQDTRRERVLRVSCDAWISPLSYLSLKLATTCSHSRPKSCDPFGQRYGRSVINLDNSFLATDMLIRRILALSKTLLCNIFFYQVMLFVLHITTGTLVFTTLNHRKLWKGWQSIEAIKDLAKKKLHLYVSHEI